MNVGIFLISLFIANTLFAAEPYVSKVWIADNGDGTFTNPVLYADYSDPDVCRVGEDFYMTASSFNCVPALPILHSKDLVNWTLVGNVFEKQLPFDTFDIPQHGNGVWAPSIRFHNNEFYIYWGDPDFGIYMTKASKAEGPWSTPTLVKGGKGLIDACPLWDENGKVYMSYAYAGSRAGLKSVLLMTELTVDGSKAIGEGRIVFDGHTIHGTIEGTKFYKRNGYYYIFAPAGGVSTGWQVVMRSKSVYGPYDDRIVLAQGNTTVNGPHQGAWVELANGDNWFIHFQDVDAYGRIIHLQPMVWKKDGFPVIGTDADKDGIGEPVKTYKKPNVGKVYPICTPIEDDDFSSNSLGLQWQWHANPEPKWFFTDAKNSVLRLFCRPVPSDAIGLWQVPNLLLTKLTAPEFVATTKISFKPSYDGERAGVVVMGENYSYLALEKRAEGVVLVKSKCKNARKGGKEVIESELPFTGTNLFVKIEVKADALCQFSYSVDGKKYTKIGEVLRAVPGRWIGAKIGYFATSSSQINDAGWLDIDWYKVTK